MNKTNLVFILKHCTNTTNIKFGSKIKFEIKHTENVLLFEKENLEANTNVHSYFVTIYFIHLCSHNVHVSIVSNKIN